MIKEIQYQEISDMSSQLLKDASLALYWIKGLCHSLIYIPHMLQCER